MEDYMKFRYIAISLMLVIIFAVTFGFSKDAAKSKIPDYSAVERDKVPSEYKWKVDDIYPNIEAWQKDKEKLQGMINGIDAYTKDWTSSPQNVLAFMEYLDTAFKIFDKLFSYAQLQNDSDLSNSTFQKMTGEIQMVGVNFNSKLSFLSPDIIKMGMEKFNEYEKAEPKLAVYRMSFDQVLRTKDHVLSEDKEKIISMTGMFSGVMAQASGMLNDSEIPNPKVTLSDGVEYELNYATFSRLRASKNPADREKNMLAYWGNIKKFENTLGILVDAQMKAHFFYALVRNYKDCLEAQLYPQAIDTSVYYNLISTVRSNLSPFHRYLKLKKQLLGLDTFKYADLYASSVPKVVKEYTYDEAKNIVLSAMKPLGKEYTGLLADAFNKGWIDVYPNKDKQSGAYSGGLFGVHPYVKMNFDGSYDSVSTLAHELGHALHSCFSNKYQPYANHNYTHFLAEIASTFNENLLLEYLLKNEKDDLFKLYLLDSFFEQLRGSVLRQTLLAEFELEIHKYVEKGGTLTPDWMNSKYLELTREYYGHKEGICIVDDYIQNEWSIIPHFLVYNYYVYQYATGFMSSMALSSEVLKGDLNARDRYLTFLKSGSSKYSLDILKNAGVDLTTVKPFEAALKKMDELVTEMEKLAAKLKKEGRI
jgi:oligoendopeptidase F